MLDEHSHEALHGAEGCTVNHHRTVLLVVLTHVFELEALWQLVVNLDGTQLPAASDGILHHKVKLGTIESSLTKFRAGLHALLLTSVDDSLLGCFPILVASDILLGILGITQ